MVDAMGPASSSALREKAVNGMQLPEGGAPPPLQGTEDDDEDDEDDEAPLDTAKEAELKAQLAEIRYEEGAADDEALMP